MANLCVHCALILYLQTIQRERHYYSLISLHKDNDEKFPIQSPERSERVISFKTQRNNQQKVLKITMSESKIITLASFKVAWILAKHKRYISSATLRLYYGIHVSASRRICESH